jgi:alpha-L-fucosidase
VGGWEFDLSGLPTTPFVLHDGYPEPYYVTSPCLAEVPDVASFCANPPAVASPAVQAASAELCLGLGLWNETSVSVLSPQAPGAGLNLTLLGGDTYSCGYSRQVTYNLVCDASAPWTQGPEPTVFTGVPPCGYTVVWAHPAACGVYNASAQCPTAPLPLPTASQALYQEHEIAGLTHFNIETFVTSGQSCSTQNWNSGVNASNPALFQPTNLNVSNWIASYEALGAKHAILTAKHGCGFLLWDSNVTLPGGQEFPYGVMRAGNPGTFGRSVVDEFLQATRAAGINPGFYYSMGSSFYLCRNNGGQLYNTSLPGQFCADDDQYAAIIEAHLQELWGRVSDGPLFEIWFDGGPLQDSWVAATLAQLQPLANGFGGQGVTPNVVRWVGTESGTPSCPTGLWSTGGNGCGDPDSPDFAPACCDTTLQDLDEWFWIQNLPIRNLQTLIQVYHATVGQNAVLELDFAIDNTGNVDPTHAAMYAQFGTWIRSCYGTPVVATSGNATTLTLTLNGATTVDRVIIQENIRLGQRVRAFSVDVLPKSTGTWQNFLQGTSIGHKFIGLGTPVPDATQIRLTITSSAAPPILINFAAFAPCPSQ